MGRSVWQQPYEQWMSVWADKLIFIGWRDKRCADSFLTVVAEEGGALADPFLFYGLTAVGTWLAGLAVYLKLLREVAWLAIAVLEVPEGGASLLDGGFEYIFDVASQGFILIQRHLVAGALGVDAAHEQGFIGVDVAYAHYDLPVHDEALHRNLALLGDLVQIFSVECRTQWFRSQVFEQLMLQRVVSGPEYCAESARVPQAQAGAGEDQIEVVVFFRFTAAGYDAQAAGHAQVHDQGAVSKTQQQIFCSPFDLVDLVTGDYGLEPYRDRPA